MYNVLISFTDNVDGGVYYAGKNTYPRDGVAPTDERVAYLRGSGNKFGKPVIAKSEEMLAEEENAKEEETAEEEIPAKKPAKK